MFLREVSSKYHVYGKEVSDSGTPHLQGYIIFDQSLRFNKVKEVLGATRIHLEVKKGSPQQASDYCKKSDQTPFQSGLLSYTGKRTDLHSVADAIMDGKSLKEVAEEYPTTFIKYARGIASYKFVLFSPAEWRDLTVTVLWGPTGTGKTKKAVTVDSVFILTDKWFCGYNGEKRLVIDEFYGWLPWCSLLRICDGYKYQCETKGGKVWAEWTEVVITSNKPPKFWYKCQHDISALLRRITTIEKME